MTLLHENYLFCSPSRCFLCIYVYAHVNKKSQAYVRPNSKSRILILESMSEYLVRSGKAIRIHVPSVQNSVQSKHLQPTECWPLLEPAQSIPLQSANHIRFLVAFFTSLSEGEPPRDDREDKPQEPQPYVQRKAEEGGTLYDHLRDLYLEGMAFYGRMGLFKSSNKKQVK